MMELKTARVMEEFFKHLLYATVSMMTFTGILLIIYLFLTEGGG